MANHSRRVVAVALLIVTVAAQFGPPPPQQQFDNSQNPQSQFGGNHFSQQQQQQPPQFGGAQPRYGFNSPVNPLGTSGSSGANNAGSLNQPNATNRLATQNQPNQPNAQNPPNTQQPNPRFPSTGSFPIEVTVQLRGYANPQSMLDQQRTCACTSGDCLSVSPQGLGFRCFFSFMIIVSSADSSVQYRATEFLLLNAAGQIDSNYTQRFAESFTFTLQNQPTAIDIFVHNLGPVIDAYTKKLEQANTVYHVDTFVHPLNGTSTVRAGQQQQTTLSGSLLGTQLSLSYSVSCKNAMGLIGPGCDLSCNASTINSGSAICTNQRTGFFSLCRWNGGRDSVTDCNNCPWGIRDNSYCMDESGDVLDPRHAGVVAEGFRTATIILGVICGLLLLCCVAAIIVGCCARHKFRRPTQPPANRTEHEFLTQSGDGADVRPLNVHAANPNTTFSTAASTPQPPSIIRNGAVPTPFMGIGPPRPTKTVLRSPHLYGLPVSHLSGGANSLNSSFSSTIAASHVPPSISADV